MTKGRANPSTVEEWQDVAIRLLWTLGRVCPDDARDFSRIAAHIKKELDRVAMEARGKRVGHDVRSVEHNMLAEAAIDERLRLLVPDDGWALGVLEVERDQSYRGRW